MGRLFLGLIEVEQVAFAAHRTVRHVRDAQSRVHEPLGSEKPRCEVESWCGRRVGPAGGGLLVRYVVRMVGAAKKHRLAVAAGGGAGGGGGGGRIAMTPALQQALRLLRLSRLELIEEIRAELDANPVSGKSTLG